MTKTNDDPLLTVDQAAALSGRNPLLIHRWIRNGVLPAAKDRDGGHGRFTYRIKESDLIRVNGTRPAHGRRLKTVTLTLSNGKTMTIEGVRVITAKAED